MSFVISHFPNVPVRFDGDRFISWRDAMLNTLVAAGVDATINPANQIEFSERYPNDPSAWNRASAAAWTIVWGSLEERIRDQFVATPSNIQSLWMELHKAYNVQDASHKAAALLAWGQCVRSKFASCAEFLTAQNKIATAASASGLTIDPEVKWRMLLGCLDGESYRAFRDSHANLMAQGTMNWEIMVQRIRALEEDQFDIFPSPQPSVPPTPSAMFAKAQKCNRCKSASHAFDHCPQVVCHKCQRPGHSARVCKAPRPVVANVVQPSLSSPGVSQVPMQGLPSGSVFVMTAESAAQLVAQLANKSNDLYRWLLDSGASQSMTPHRFDLCNFEEGDFGSVKTAGGEVLPVKGEGDVLVGGVVHRGVAFVPGLKERLISIGHFTTEHHVKMILSGWGCEVERDGRILFKVPRDRMTNLYIIGGRGPQELKTMLARRGVVEPSKGSLTEWHYRLGHPNDRSLTELIDKKLVVGAEVNDRSPVVCEPCIQGKMTRTEHDRIADRVPEAVGEIVSADLIVTGREESGDGEEMYALITVDHFSGYTSAQPLITRSDEDVSGRIIEFLNFLECQSGRSVKIFRTDMGNEFRGKQLEGFLRNKGIIHEFAAPRDSSGNGRSERLNRTIREKAVTILRSSGVDSRLWPWAIRTAAFLHNRTGRSSYKDETPYQVLFGITPDVSKIREFGSVCYVLNEQADQWGDKTIKGILLGFGEASEVYTVKLDDGRVVVSRNVRFSPLAHEEQTRMPQEISISRERNRRVSERLAVKKLQSFAVLENEQDDYIHVMMASSNNPGVRDALSGPDRECWMEAIRAEKTNLVEKDVLRPVDGIPSKKPITCRTILTRKVNSDGEFTRNKARLVVQGFRQVQGIDYHETFAPVCKATTVRILFTVADILDHEIFQMDIDCAYLNAPLSEEVYVKLPPEMVGKDGQEIYRLNKALYGLKQAGHEWYGTLRSTLEKLGWIRSKVDECLFSRPALDGYRNYLLIYVDDILVLAKNRPAYNIIMTELSSHFTLKSLGEARSVLGMTVERRKDGTTLCQRGLVNSILDRFSHQFPVTIRSTPCGKVTDKYLGEATDWERRLYQQCVGALNHLAQWTRPDICTAVSLVSRRSSNPGPEDYNAVGRLLGYLTYTADYKLKLEANDSQAKILCFSDSDYADDKVDRKSQSGYIVKVGGRTVSWRSAKQASVAQSTMEAEFVAMAESFSEATFVKKLIDEMGVSKLSDPIELLSDNQAAISAVKNPVHHSRAKHIDIKYHSIREGCENGKLRVTYVPSVDNQADIMTKGLVKQAHIKIMTLIGMGPWGSVGNGSTPAVP
jgi:hypothetical protein